MANEIEFTVDGNALRRAADEASTLVLRNAQRRIIASAKATTPVDTGELRGSHRGGNIKLSAGRAETEIVAEQEYATYVHEGTRPHVIRPKNAKVLAWGGKPPSIFATSVNHPGTKAQPWLLNALKSEGARLGFVVTPSR